MYAEERRAALTTMARAEGRVSVSEAAQAFGVTTETIRRDLDVLVRQGLLRKVHGGAIPVSPPEMGDRSVVERTLAAALEKEQIARAALGLVPEGASLLLDSGTTTYRLAQLLADQPSLALTVVTNSVPAAVVLAAVHDTHLLGGRVRGVTQAVVGSDALAALDRTWADLCFLGTNGVTVHQGLSTPDPEEAAVKRAMVTHARTVVCLTDARKVGNETLSRFARLDDVDVLITDSSLELDTRTRLEATGIEVVLA